MVSRTSEPRISKRMTLLTMCNRLHLNESAYDRYLIRPRVLRDISKLDTSSKIWGKATTIPFGLSPSAMHRLAHPDGEVGTSKACAARRVPMALSGLSNDTLEDVSAQSVDGLTPYAIQTSPFNDRRITTNLLTRAKGVWKNFLKLSFKVRRYC